VSSEYEHLKTDEERNREFLIERAKELRDEGWKQQEIANELGIAVGTVHKYLNL
jgi:orotate phosphoribosyltransferase-like protein